MAAGVLDEIATTRGLVDYRIQADSELNTADTIDRNEFYARIGIQPTRAVEFIFIEFSVHRTGSFDETSETF
jgi:phage tail sheath protein FI